MYFLSSFLVAFIVLVSTALGWAADEEQPKDIISEQIRKQGVACVPLKAEPDLEHSKPDLKAWILTCREGTYRVILVPDMAARVERID